jgi:hypothetical protein
MSSLAVLPLLLLSLSSLLLLLLLLLLVEAVLVVGREVRRVRAGLSLQLVKADSNMPVTLLFISSNTTIL